MTEHILSLPHDTGPSAHQWAIENGIEFLVMPWIEMIEEVEWCSPSKRMGKITRRQVMLFNFLDEHDAAVFKIRWDGE